MDVELRTSRLHLRTPERRDAPNIVRYLNDFAVSGNLSMVPHPYTEADALSWIDGFDPNGTPHRQAFALVLPDAGLIGICGLHLAAGGCEIGYWLGQPFWNRGFMSEAAGAVVDWFFARTDDAGLLCGAFSFNKASLAVQRKLGFTETGLSRRHCLARGLDLRHIDTQLTRARWTERAAALASQAIS